MVFDKVLDAVIDYLGDYDKESFSITLYDVPNKPDLINKIKSNVSGVTKKFKWVVLSPKEQFTNIKILDIDL